MGTRGGRRDWKVRRDVKVQEIAQMTASVWRRWTWGGGTVARKKSGGFKSAVLEAKGGTGDMDKGQEPENK